MKDSVGQAIAFGLLAILAFSLFFVGSIYLANLYINPSKNQQLEPEEPLGITALDVNVKLISINPNITIGSNTGPGYNILTVSNASFDANTELLCINITYNNVSESECSVTYTLSNNLTFSLEGNILKTQSTGSIKNKNVNITVTITHIATNIQENAVFRITTGT